MGSGNVCVTGEYEGLFYIDSDDYYTYGRFDEDTDLYEMCQARGLGYDETCGKFGWKYDEVATREELDDILECFIDSFTDTFRSFKKVEDDRWLDKIWNRKILLENGLFYICIEDNQWSQAIELIQKEDWYDDHLKGLQKQHYSRYLEGMKQSLLKRLPSIGIYTGAWTSGTLRREEVFYGTGQAQN